MLLSSTKILKAHFYFLAFVNFNLQCLISLALISYLWVLVMLLLGFSTPWLMLPDGDCHWQSAKITAGMETNKNRKQNPGPIFSLSFSDGCKTLHRRIYKHFMFSFLRKRYESGDSRFPFSDFLWLPIIQKKKNHKQKRKYCVFQCALSIFFALTQYLYPYFGIWHTYRNVITLRQYTFVPLILIIFV